MKPKQKEARDIDSTSQEKDGASPSIVGEMIASFDSSMEKLGLDIEEAEEMARSIGVVSYNGESNLRLEQCLNADYTHLDLAAGSDTVCALLITLSNTLDFAPD